MFNSYTYGKLNLIDIPNKILDYYRKMSDFCVPIRIIIGTDSQNFSNTKLVSVIAVICEGHGGIFFYEISRQPLIRDVRKKLHIETNESLQLALELVDLLSFDSKYEDVYLNCPISIHIDAGNSDNGKTKDLIPELVGWITSLGYDCTVKPDSFVASSIADKISK